MLEKRVATRGSMCLCVFMPKMFLNGYYNYPYLINCLSFTFSWTSFCPARTAFESEIICNNRGQALTIDGNDSNGFVCLFRENSSVCDHAYILRNNLKPVTTRIIFNELLVRSAEFRISPLSFSSKALLSWVGFKGLLSLKLQRVSKVDFVYNMSERTMICNFAFICSHL